MIKVECTSCQNPYELDEKRLPQAGLRMRCPKCGVSFVVFPDGRTQASAAIKPPATVSAAPAQPKPAPPAAPPRPGAPPGAFASKPRPGTGVLDEELDLPAPVAPRPAGGARLTDDGDLPAKPSRADNLDLPAVAAKKPVGAPQLKDDLDLPAPARPGAPVGARAKPAIARPVARPVLGDDLDLPAAAPPKKPGAPITLDDPDLPSSSAVRDDLDLPARPISNVDLPAARAKAGTLPGLPPRPAFGAAAARPKTSVGLGPPAPPKPEKPVELDIDLPAPRAAKPEVDVPARVAKPSLDLDLPAQRAAKPSLDLDLPAPRAAKPSLDVDLPAPRAAKPSLDLDLPAPRASSAAASLDLDLPAPRGKPVPVELDLPAPKGAASSGLELDLPAPRNNRSALATTGTPFDDLDAPPSLELDLPTPRRSGAGGDILDLPAPRGELTDLPAPLGAVDLPQPSLGGIDLPMPRGISDLPTARGALDLPVARGASDLPVSRGAVDLPQPGLPKTTRERAAFDLPIPGAGPSFPPSTDSPFNSAPSAVDSKPSGAAAFGDLDLPLPGGPTAPAPPPARLHGEVSLPGADAAGAEGTEFAGIPVEPAPQAGAAPVARPLPKLAPIPTRKAAPEGAPRGGRRTAIALAVGVVALGAVGGALTFTPYGPFGYYAIEQFLPGAGDAAVVARVVAEADELALLDSYSASTEALSVLSDARRTAGLNRGLLARSLVHESLHIVRWGDDSGATRAAAIRQRLEERGTDDPALALALAADQLRSGHPERALALVARARAHAPADPLVDLVEAEAALSTGDAASALQAFQQALEHGGGARAQWGVARALSTGGDAAAIGAAVDATLALSPRHGDALLRRALLAQARGNDTLAMVDIRVVVGIDPVGEPPETIVSPPQLRGQAWATMGAIHEAAGRLSQALEAYGEATNADPGRTDALLGAGRVLLVDRPSEAITRFESVIERPDANETVLESGRTAAQDARLGAARAMLDLDRDEEAKAVLENLVNERPDDAEFHRWLGRAHALLGEHAEAEDSYEEAIALEPTELSNYLFLARLLVDLDRQADAVTTLANARSAVPETAAMREGLGRYELSLNRLPEAITEFRRALAIDHAMPAARFGLGVALRRSGAYAEALAAFEELARIDAGHPGLAMERGYLFEARGQSDRAIEYYTQALSERPDDPELLLRLGAAQVGAHDLDAAEETLARVMLALHASAEAEHFVGRIAFERGRIPEARAHFERAIQLDASRGEFLVYAAWAAFEARDLGAARELADQAIGLDPSLGDAWWIRGSVRQASGQAQTALADLTHALELRPTRYEALAAIGDCHDDLRDLPAAIDAYSRATAAAPDNARWLYRLGRLHLDADHPSEAARALVRSADLADAASPAPGWLADVHRLTGDALRLSRDRAGAIRHYQRFVELAAPGDVDLPEVQRRLRDLGVE